MERKSVPFKQPQSMRKQPLIKKSRGLATLVKFRIAFYDSKGNEYKELIINNDQWIRFNGFFYYDEESSIDFHYINNLFEDH
ncbi:hypothetical protein ACQCVK_18040 [Rossellomorea vietnamensis]